MTDVIRTLTGRWKVQKRFFWYTILVEARYIYMDMYDNSMSPQIEVWEKIKPNDFRALRIQHD